MYTKINIMRLIGFIFFIVYQFASADPTKIQSVLFIADSHGNGEFGRQVDNYLRSIALSVTSIASCGSAPSNWVAESKNYKPTNCGYWKKDSGGREVRVKSHELTSLSDQLTISKPKLVVVALGTNILSSPVDIQREKKSVEKILGHIAASGSRCIWIGPPDLRKSPFKDNLADGVKQLKSIVEKQNCTFVDSTALTKYPVGSYDGIHYDPNGSAEWGKKASQELDQIVSKLDVIKSTPTIEPKKSTVSTQQ